jgi:hypothetical protein
VQGEGIPAQRPREGNEWSLAYDIKNFQDAVSILQAGDDPTGTLHVAFILLAELLHHHLFLGTDPGEILHRREQQEREPSDPVM